MLLVYGGGMYDDDDSKEAEKDFQRKREYQTRMGRITIAIGVIIVIAFALGILR